MTIFEYKKFVEMCEAFNDDFCEEVDYFTPDAEDKQKIRLAIEALDAMCDTIHHIEWFKMKNLNALD